MSDANGNPTTLGEWRDFWEMLSGGKTHSALDFLDAKIAEQGRDETVIADPSQMFYLLGTLDSKDKQEADHAE